MTCFFTFVRESEYLITKGSSDLRQLAFYDIWLHREVYR